MAVSARDTTTIIPVPTLKILRPRRSSPTPKLWATTVEIPEAKLTIGRMIIESIR